MYTPTPRCTHGRWASYEETGLDSDRLVLMWDAETAPPVGGARYPGRSFPICKVEYTPRAPSPPTAPPSPPATVATMASVLTTCSYPLATIETHEGCEAAIRELFPTEFSGFLYSDASLPGNYLEHIMHGMPMHPRTCTCTCTCTVCVPQSDLKHIMHGMHMHLHMHMHMHMHIRMHSTSCTVAYRGSRHPCL